MLLRFRGRPCVSCVRGLWHSGRSPGGLPGDALVDLIVSGVKKVKYMHEVSCVNSWICLRQIHCAPAKHGVVRCAIKLRPGPVSPQAEPTLFKEEWGWRSEAGPRVGYIITAVREFEPFHCTFSHQGLPMLLQHCDERSRLAELVKHGTDVVVKSATTRRVKPKKYARPAERAAARERRASARECISTFNEERCVETQFPFLLNFCPPIR